MIVLFNLRIYALKKLLFLFGNSSTPNMGDRQAWVFTQTNFKPTDFMIAKIPGMRLAGNNYYTNFKPTDFMVTTILCKKNFMQVDNSFKERILLIFC